MSPLPSLGLGLSRRAKKALRAVSARLVRLGVPIVTPRIVRTLPHDPEAYTQGLTFWEGQLFESTGGHHRSSLRALDPHDGGVLRIVPVDGEFAEGITVLDGKLYQLAWKSGRARVYRLPDLVAIDELRYAGEGWGLTARDGELLMSDGTSKLSFRDSRFAVARTLRATSHGIPLRRLNDLQSVGNFIYANVWPTTDIFELSAGNGRLLRVVDCSSLAAAARPRDDNCVLNGIAYCAQRSTFFLTGKNWRLMFEVVIPGAHGSASSRPPNDDEAVAPDSSGLDAPDRAAARCVESAAGNP